MEHSAVAKSSDVREVDLADWGKVVMEELLFRAALQLADQPPSGRTVSVTMQFDLSASPDERLVLVSSPAAIEQAILTRVQLTPSVR